MSKKTELIPLTNPQLHSYAVDIAYCIENEIENVLDLAFFTDKVIKAITRSLKEYLNVNGLALAEKV